MNAVVAAGVPARDYASRFDTAWLDFTKGLGAPVGAVLAASRELIDEAWRYKQMWGGSLRQAGIIAAAGLYALDHNVDRLAEDHANARVLAEGLAELPGIELDPAEVETNIVVFGFPEPAALCAELEREGVLMSTVAAGRIRAVTHLDVDRADIDTALAVAKRVIDQSF
jgi:threonine aldolase